MKQSDSCMVFTPLYLLILAINIVLTVAAQAFLREGMKRLADTTLAEPNLTLSTLLVAVLTQPFVVAGAVSFSVSFGFWLALLSKVKIGVIYPIQQSLIFIALQFVAWRWLGEGMSGMRLVGVAVICVGVYLASRG